MLIKIDETILESGSDLRLDKFLHQHLSTMSPPLSRTYIQDLIKSGAVLVNSKPAKASSGLELDDEIAVNIPEARELEIVAENIPIEVVYEDDDLMVINKPINMVTHPTPNQLNGTLVNAIMYHVQHNGSKLSGVNGVLRPGIVHRLDKDTSGLIVVAKSDIAHKSLSEQIQTRKLERKYLALVEGNHRQDTGVINLPIGRHPVHRQKMTVITDEKSKSRYAVTYYTVLERYKFKEIFFNLLECKLDTGRTHQIRVHLAHHKHPIVGDATYGASDRILRVPRPLLHSYSMVLVHPRSGETLRFSSNPPADMQKVITMLSEQNQLQDTLS
jgi:23S rRNA pseudouridine1911/1915/1917 synthase